MEKKHIYLHMYTLNHTKWVKGYLFVISFVDFVIEGCNSSTLHWLFLLSCWIGCLYNGHARYSFHWIICNDVLIQYKSHQEIWSGILFGSACTTPNHQSIDLHIDVQPSPINWSIHWCALLPSICASIPPLRLALIW